jgi:hypothetical protein
LEISLPDCPWNSGLIARRATGDDVDPLAALDPFQALGLRRLAKGTLWRSICGPMQANAGRLCATIPSPRRPPRRTRAATRARWARSSRRCTQTANSPRDELARALASPAIARVLEQAVVTASVTDDAEIPQQLAELVAARLRARNDSNDACARLESVARHLRALAILDFVKLAEPPALPDAQLDALLNWVAPRAEALGHQPAASATPKSRPK